MKIAESHLRSLVKEVILLELRNVANEGPPAAEKYFARPVGEGYVLYYDVGPAGNPQAIPGTIGELYDNTYVRGAQSVGGSDYRLTPGQIANAKKLVSLGLFKKRVRTIDNPDITFKYRGNRPGSAESLWKSEADVPSTCEEYFLSDVAFEFLLVNTKQKLVSLEASWKENNTRRGGNTPTKISNVSYVMPSGDVAFTQKTLQLQKLFKHLIVADPRVTADYRIISPDDKFKGKTIGSVTNEIRATDIAVGGTPGKLIVYHGTSTKRWPEIQKKGMLPGKFEKAYSDQIKGYSEKNLYFTMDPHTAENYATRAAIWDKAAALILQVEIPDISRIVPDEDSMGWFILSREYNLRLTPGEKTDYGGKWDTITHSYPSVSYDRENITIGGQQHVKNILEFLKSANRTKAYGKLESEAPEAGPEYVKDDEYNALLREIEQKMAGFLIKSLRNETFAYSGRILPKFIRKWKEYPKVAYPRVVDKGGGTGREYEETRQKVIDKMKRFDKNESFLRSIVKMLL